MKRKDKNMTRREHMLKMRTWKEKKTDIKKRKIKTEMEEWLKEKE